MGDRAIILRGGVKMAVTGVTTLAVRSSDFSDSTGTLSDVSGLSFSVEANEIVFAEIVGLHYSNATGSGMKIAFSGPASPTHVRYGFDHFNGVNAVRTIEAAQAFGTELSEAAGGSVLELAFRVYLFLTNGSNAGTVQFRAAAESGSTSLTITRGATLRVYRIG